MAEGGLDAKTWLTLVGIVMLFFVLPGSMLEYDRRKKLRHSRRATGTAAAGDAGSGARRGAEGAPEPEHHHATRGGRQHDVLGSDPAARSGVKRIHGYDDELREPQRHE